MSRHDTSQNDTLTYYEQIDIPQTSISQLSTVIYASWMANIIPILIGAAGAGKTELVHAIKNHLDADMLHLYIAHLGSEEIKGLFFRSADSDKTYSVLANEEMFNAVENSVKSGKKLILFCDELNRASDQDTLNAIFSMFSKRGIPGIEFNENVYIIAAGNPPTGKYAVAEMADDAFVRRMLWLGLRIDHGIWLKYAQGKNTLRIDHTTERVEYEELPLHESVIKYVRANPQRLFDEALANRGRPHPNPASWTKVSNLLKVMNAMGIANPLTIKVALSGLIGQANALGFFAFYSDGHLLVSPEEIISEKWESLSKKLGDINEEGRHDICAELVTALAMFLVNEMPEPTKKVLNNIIDFMLWLPEDQKQRFATGLLGDKNSSDYGDYLIYKDKLVAGLQDTGRFEAITEKLHQLSTL